MGLTSRKDYDCQAAVIVRSIISGSGVPGLFNFFRCKLRNNRIDASGRRIFFGNKICRIRCQPSRMFMQKPFQAEPR